MRTLKFNVDRQMINKDEKCDFKGIVPGTEGYLEAEFTFSEEWDGCAKAAVFCCSEVEYPVPVIENRCMIPSEALAKRYFDVMVIGEKDGYRICTSREEVRQNG